MRHANNMSHIAQAELEQLVCQDTSRITEPEQTVVSEHSVQTHRPRMQQAFMAQIAE